jgi:hypothetical protein
VKTWSKNTVMTLWDTLIENRATTSGPTDIANFNQVLSKHLNDIVFHLTFFGANMSCEHKKRKKWPGLLKQYFDS